MGRIFEKRKHKMFARFDKMSKAFTRIGKDIAIAVKLAGPDPAANPRLRMALQNARGANMPKDRVEAAIKRAVSKDAENLAEVVYEGYGPHGVAIVVETATDNTTRTVANVRSYFTRAGGSLATSGALDFMFQRRGVFKLPAEGNLEELELLLIECGAEDIEIDEDVVTAYTEYSEFVHMQRALEEKNVNVISAEVQRIPTTMVSLNDEQSEELEKLIDKIEDDDDVQAVYHNIA